MADRKTVVGHKKLDSDKNLQLDKELDLHLKALRKAEDWMLEIEKNIKINNKLRSKKTRKEKIVS